MFGGHFIVRKLVVISGDTLFGTDWLPSVARAIEGRHVVAANTSCVVIRLFSYVALFGFSVGHEAAIGSHEKDHVEGAKLLPGLVAGIV